jgi:hypothetical protein
MSTGKDKPQQTATTTSHSLDPKLSARVSRMLPYAMLAFCSVISLYVIRYSINRDMAYGSYRRAMGIACANQPAYELLGAILVTCFLLFPAMTILSLCLGLCRGKVNYYGLLLSWIPFALFLVLFLASSKTPLLFTGSGASLIMTSRNEEMVLVQFEFVEFWPSISFVYTQPERVDEINTNSFHITPTHPGMSCDSTEASLLCPTPNWILQTPTSPVVRCKLSTNMIFESLPILLSSLSMGAFFCVVTVGLFLPSYCITFFLA